MDSFDFIGMFEKKLSDYTGAPYVVLTDSCTSAIFLCLKLYKPTIITCPKNTYHSVPMHILYAGHKLHFENIKWYESYNFAPTNIFDYAYCLREGMYKKGQYQCLSFHYKKPLHVNKGGCILLDNKEHYELLNKMAYDGRDRITKMKDLKDISVLGYHMMMTPETACEGLLNWDRKKPSVARTDKDYDDTSKYSCFEGLTC